jgi:cytochrome b involved in lipid metabolism
MSNNTFSREEVSNHGTAEKGLWVIVDGYVLDLTSFIQHHPGSAPKIIQRCNKSVDVLLKFLDHFGHTVRTFREACTRNDQVEGNMIK